jgi:hypothetical protein
MPIDQAERLRLITQLAAGMLSNSKYHELDVETGDYFPKGHIAIMAAGILDDLWSEVVESEGAPEE